MSHFISLTLLTASLAGCMMIDSVQLNTHWGDTHVEASNSCEVYLPPVPTPMPVIPTPDAATLQDPKLKQKFLVNLLKTHREYIINEQQKSTTHYSAYVDRCK